MRGMGEQDKSPSPGRQGAGPPHHGMAAARLPCLTPLPPTPSPPRKPNPTHPTHHAPARATAHTTP